MWLTISLVLGAVEGAGAVYQHAAGRRASHRLSTIWRWVAAHCSISEGDHWATASASFAHHPLARAGRVYGDDVEGFGEPTVSAGVAAAHGHIGCAGLGEVFQQYVGAVPVVFVGYEKCVGRQGLKSCYRLAAGAAQASR